MWSGLVQHSPPKKNFVGAFEEIHTKLSHNPENSGDHAVCLVCRVVHDLARQGTPCKSQSEAEREMSSPLRHPLQIFQGMASGSRQSMGTMGTARRVDVRLITFSG